MNMVCYRYDGTFEGFLSCVFTAYEHHETPCAFLAPDAVQESLYPVREITSDPERARRVYKSLSTKISRSAGEMLAHVSLTAQQLVANAFLTCLPERELHIFAFIALGYKMGGAVMRNLTDPRVAILTKAVGHMMGEVQLLRGFVRFSDTGSVLVSEIEPKNRVLPLLRPHFCGRFPAEHFIIYDRTNKEALFHEPGRWIITPLDEFSAGAPEEPEAVYRKLWKRFYDTIAIEGRINPKLRRTHMPKRYWNTMTEMQEEATALP